MAVPKKRRSHSKKYIRKGGNLKKSNIAISNCIYCNELNFFRFVCKQCYNK